MLIMQHIMFLGEMHSKDEGSSILPRKDQNYDVLIQCWQSLRLHCVCVCLPTLECSEVSIINQAPIF